MSLPQDEQNPFDVLRECQIDGFSVKITCPFSMSSVATSAFPLPGTALISYDAVAGIINAEQEAALLQRKRALWFRVMSAVLVMVEAREEGQQMAGRWQMAADKKEWRLETLRKKNSKIVGTKITENLIVGGHVSTYVPGGG